MIGRNHMRLSAVASAMFATVCVFPYLTVSSNTSVSDMLQLVVEIHNTQALILPVTSHIESSQSRRQAEAYRTLMGQVYCCPNKLSGKYVYKHPKLGFSLEYSESLTAREFPDGVVLENFLENNAMQIYDRIDIQVTNIALQLGCRDGSVETFKSFRSAKAGELVKGSESGTYTKIANLKVNGYPAVRVVYEVTHEYAAERNTKAEDLPSFFPVYSVSVYIQKGTDIWEVMSQGIDKKTQEKGAKTFEEILRTLKFA